MKKAGVSSERVMKKKKKKRTSSFSSYLYKVLRQVHPDTGMSMRAMKVLDCLFHARSLRKDNI